MLRTHHKVQAGELPCAAGTLRRATRSVARLYDGRLAKAGLTTTQFSLLRAIERFGKPMPVGRLAEEQVFERTSLYRALAPLGRAKLIRLGDGADRRVTEVELTALGRRRIARALPYWRSAQRAFAAEFGIGAWRRLAAELGGIVQAARAI